jgi:hypothetical protein
MRVTMNWGTAIASVYTVFAVSTLGFVTFAMARPVDLVATDYYAQALRQDERMLAERNAQALRPAPAVRQVDGRTVLLSLPASHAESASGTVTLYRASDARADRSLPLAIGQAGLQRIALDGLAPGQWLVKVQWQAGGLGYYVEGAAFAR